MASGLVRRPRFKAKYQQLRPLLEWHSAVPWLCHSSRGQKVVSLFSAESELHGLVSGAVDGIALRVSLEFLLNVKVQHVCLIDNSATRQISNKRGSSRLRHVSGKLLWVQDQTSAKTLEVKQIGTAFNIVDIGTKPLGSHRLYALMFWCNLRDQNGNQGEGEQHDQSQDHACCQTPSILCSFQRP